MRQSQDCHSHATFCQIKHKVSLAQQHRTKSTENKIVIQAIP